MMMISECQSTVSGLIALLLLRACAVRPQKTEETDQPTAAESSSKDLALPCGHPGNIEHGVTDWNGTGALAKFACYQGYYLVGPPRLVCRSDSPHYSLLLFISLNIK